jgi:LacI family transcriptional regulator
MSYHQYTLKDIAKELNTSITTVSRALKNHRGISEGMRKKVITLAKEVDFHPNPNALSLLQSRTYTIGVIVPEIAHSFYSIVMEGIEDAATEAGYNVLFCMSKESAEREKNVLNTLVRNRVDGLLIAISKETEEFGHFEALFNREFPLVFVDAVKKLPI